MIEWFKDFDINNVWIVIAISISLILLSSHYIQLLHASKIEVVLMEKGDEAKRFGFVYIILFFVFGVVNFVFTTKKEFIVVNTILFFLAMAVSFILRLLKNKWKFKNWYWWFEERKDLAFIITSTSIFTFLLSVVVDINVISCAILGALVETMIVAIVIVNVGNIRAFISLNIESEKWYVFKRIDGDYLLCGNRNNINESTRTRLLSIDYLVKEKIYFEKENIAFQGQRSE